MRAILQVLLIAIATATVSTLSYVSLYGYSLEEHLGLKLLFSFRGPISAPDDAVVVALDREGAEELGLPDRMTRWPRAVYARLIETLRSAGARTITIDVFFKEARDPEGDLALANALRRSNNVVLFAHLERMAGEARNIERLVTPIEPVAASVRALANFALPRVPVRVDEFWTFRPTAGDLPTLPAVTLQLYLLRHYGDLRDRVNAFFPSADLPAADHVTEGRVGVLHVVESVRRLFIADPGGGVALLRHLERVDPRSPLLPLVRLYLSPELHLLNLYGPARTVRTLSFSKVLAATDPATLELQDRAVFVGLSEQQQPGQQEGFYTVFSKPDGLDLSGVEIGATAFLNLLHGHSLRYLPLPLLLGILVLHAVIVATFGLVIKWYWAALASLGVAVLFLAAAIIAFTQTYLVVPCLLPLSFQTPVALLGAMALRQRLADQARRTAERALGLYLPESAVERIMRQAAPMLPQEPRYGVCLFTDASAYTTLGEAFSPGDLAAFLNEYYQRLFAPVRSRGGIVSDIIGDAMLALFLGDDAVKDRRGACEASLDILEQVAAFNATHRATPLLTTVGLHAGPIVVGNVGAVDHYEYRAVGDMVNTASRIQGLTKHLGCTVLASREAIEGLPEFKVRHVGSFQLVGKRTPLALYEIVSRHDATTPEVDEKVSSFEQVIECFESCRTPECEDLLRGFLERFPEDGPGRFLQRHIELLREAPAVEPPRCIVMTQK